MTSDSPSPQQAQQQIIDRAGSDPAFRSQLLENPKEAIRDQLKIPLPGSVTVRVIEEQPGEVILVLPAQHIGSGTRLSGEDLEKVAGGQWGDTWFYPCK